MSQDFVPPDFVVPTRYGGDGFRLEPLGPEHNERDYEAWTSSIEHIRATPGFPDGNWPYPMSLEKNLSDLERHADDFAKRRGFTYTVIADDDVVGCVYIYPSRSGANDAEVQSWVRVSHSELDPVVWSEVSGWLAEEWPFANPEYASRR